ncbi:MAG TPA: CHASE4 domain-containing protein [Candidatus Acidoferrales bacterium]|nr:CHASE4 domain-containing protein [Candidatus Acidoferrales bacterium]
MASIPRSRLHLPHSLRGKTLVIVLITVFALVGGLYGLARMVLLRGYSTLESDFARQDIDRASSGLQNEIASLGRTNSDYSSWDETYRFLKGKNPQFPAEQFPSSELPQIKVNFVLIVDNAGRRVFSQAYDLLRNRPTHLPPGLAPYVTPSVLLPTHGKPWKGAAGIVMLDSGPYVVDARPVLTSKSEGPAMGTIIMGRALDQQALDTLASITHLTISLIPVHTLAEQTQYETTTGRLIRPNHVDIQAEGPDSLAAYEEVTDINGSPALILRVSVPRDIYRQAQTTLLQFLLLLLAAGLTFGAVTLYLLERTVLSRIAHLSQDVTEIGASGDLSARADVSGRDELAFLGNAINGMLEDLQRAEMDRDHGRVRLAMIVEKMPAVLWTMDKDLRFTSSIGAGLERIGQRPNQTVGVTIEDYFRTDDPEFPPIAAHRRALAGEAISYEMDWEKCTFESYVQPLRDLDGEIMGVIGIALDITERKHLADQLRQSQKMQAVGQLAGGVAHDFNNLLMVVKGHAEILLNRMAGNSPLRNNVEQVDKAADRATALTRQLLAFSRMQVLQPRVLDLNEVVGGMTKMFSRVIGENIEMTFVPGAKLGRVKADPGQIEQVLLNLVVNARDAMPNGGRITIETTNVQLDKEYSAKHHNIQPGSWVMLTVSDTGSGMDARTQTRIFEPFFTTKEKGKGTGLGLATVYGVVKQSGGFIYVYSEVNQGTTFKIYLPKVVAEVHKDVAENPAGPPPHGSETVLFVEDEESVRELVTDYLKAVGYNVLVASNGAQALQMAAAHAGTIEILVTDVVMPRISGRELAAQIAAARPNVKVLYISGYTDDSIFRHGVLEGGVAYLQKPFNLKAIAQKIREVLDGHTATVQTES